jgi:hypothetical protein
MSQYEADSPPALALQQQIDRTKARFDKYSRSDLLCGTDGLPHLVADGVGVMQLNLLFQDLGLSIFLVGLVGLEENMFVQ